MTTGPLTVLVLPDSEPVEKRRKRTVNAATWWTATYWKDLISLGIGSEQAHMLRLLALETGGESHLRWHVDHSRTCTSVFPKAHGFCCIFVNDESIYALRYCLLSLENYQSCSKKKRVSKPGRVLRLLKRDRQDGTHTLRHGLSVLLMSHQISKSWDSDESAGYVPFSTWLGLGLVFGLVLGVWVKG